MNSPDIEEAPPCREEINKLAIGRPVGLVVPLFAIRDANPRPPSRRHHIDRRFFMSLLSAYRLENDPTAVRRESSLPELVTWVRNNLLCFPFCVCVGHKNLPDFGPASFLVLLRRQ